MSADPKRDSTPGPPYRDYTEEPLAVPAPVPPLPTPGTGTVFVAHDGDGDCEASWQSGDSVENFRGTESEVVAWAHSRPAAKRVRFSREDHSYIPL